MLADVSTYLNAGALVKILLIGLVAGAGLTAIYSLGVEALSRGGYGSEAEDGHSTSARSPLALVMAIVCFLVVVGGVAYGVSVALTK
jgi:hypothetical protein